MSVVYSCGECGEEVTDDDKAIQCESDCMCWFHADCVNLTDRRCLRGIVENRHDLGVSDMQNF